MLLQVSASHFVGFFAPGLLDTTVGGSWIIASLGVLAVALDPTFCAHLVPGGTLQEPFLGEVVVVPLATEAGPGLHNGDFHAATSELALCTFGRLFCFNSPPGLINVGAAHQGDQNLP